MRYYIITRQTILYSCLALVHSFPPVTSVCMLAPTTKIISSLSIKASRVTVPCHNSQTIMTAPASFAITSSFPGSHRVPTPLTLKRPVMAAPTSLKIGVATHSAGRDFFSAEPPHPRSLSLAHARHAGPTTGPRTAAGTTPCRPPHVPTSPTPLQRPRRLCRLGARAFSAATIRVDDELPRPTPSPVPARRCCCSPRL